MNIKAYDFYYSLRSLLFIEAIYLYGSRAKGTSGSRSDIDLAIMCPKATKEQWQQVRKIIDESDTLLKIDCVRLDTLEDSRLKDEILRDKVLLFERKESSYEWYELFLDLGEAIDKLEYALNPGKTDYLLVREATIHVFEYSFELFWKVLKKICALEGVETNSPRSTLTQAFMFKLIDDEEMWLDMMEDRNLTSHTYKQPTAKEIFKHIKNYVVVMRRNYEQLKERYKI